MTLYFANEVPLDNAQLCRSLDSAPLLKDPQENGLELSKLKSDIPVLSNSNNENINGSTEKNLNLNHTNSFEVQNESFGDGPGAVLVNLLTSLRHLPPGMHSVLVVMALTWVSISMIIFIISRTQWSLVVPSGNFTCLILFIKCCRIICMADKGLAKWMT